MMVGLLVMNEGKLLLVSIDKEEGDEKTYSLPMGKVKEGEDLKSAAMRQLYEEIGLVTTADDLDEVSKGIEIIVNGEKINLTVYKCKRFEGFLFLFGEETTPEWIDVTRVGDLKLLPNVDNIIKEFLDTANI